MEIIFHGQSFFEISLKNNDSKQVNIAIDPFGDEIGLKPPKAEADILLLSHNHKDHSNTDIISGDYFLIDSLGEFEVKGVLVQGIAAFHDNTQGKDRGSVVIFKIDAEGIKLCFLSDLGQDELSSEQVEEIGEVDVLFCPVGGNYTINAKGAAHIISQIEPRLVIPMHYFLPGLKAELESVEKFLKQMGDENPEKTKKLKVNLKTLPLDETKILVLEP